MKTFKKWFEARNEETQQYLLKKCLWIDVNSPDKYRHPKNAEEIKNSVVTYASTRLINDDYVDSDKLHQLLAVYLQNDKDMKAKDPEAYYNTLVVLWKNAQEEIELAVDAMDLREIYKRKHVLKRRWPDKYRLSEILLVTEDFDNIDWSDLDETIQLDTISMDIFGHEKIIEAAKANPDMVRIERTAMKNDLFDELFFCENGWTKSQKEHILRNWSTSLDGVRDFMERVVAVDESYLRYIGTYFIYQEPALAAHLYKEKKPITELNALPAGHSQTEEFRYPKHYRKLFHIAACCARKNVGKALAGTIGDVACTLKMYGYDFNQVFDCMYPEFAETAEENTEAVAV